MYHVKKNYLKLKKSLSNNKSTGDHGFTKEFCENILVWSKKTFLICIFHSFGKEELCTSQREAFLKLIEKKDKDESLIQNWKPVCL